MSTYQSQHDDVLSLQFCVLKDKTTEFLLGLFTFGFKNAFWSIRSQVDRETRCECKQAKRHSSWQTPQQNVNTTLQLATYEDTSLDTNANLPCCPFNPYRITENTFYQNQFKNQFPSFLLLDFLHSCPSCPSSVLCVPLFLHFPPHLHLPASSPPCSSFGWG